MSGLSKLGSALLLALLCAASAGACTCAGVGPACNEALSPRVSAVFLGVVEAIENPKWGSSSEVREFSASFVGTIVEVKLRVEEAYKGISAPSAIVITAANEAACGFPFKKNEKYLIYASEQQGRLYTSICQRTRPIRFAADDLAFLRNMKNRADTSDIFGEYKRYTYDPNFIPKFTPSIMDHYRPAEEEYEALAPMAGETVTLTSDGHDIKTTVGKDGKFVFRGGLHRAGIASK